MTNQAKNITENPRIATRIEIRQGYPCLILEAWNDSGRDFHTCRLTRAEARKVYEALKDYFEGDQS